MDEVETRQKNEDGTLRTARKRTAMDWNDPYEVAEEGRRNLRDDDLYYQEMSELPDGWDRSRYEPGFKYEWEARDSTTRAQWAGVKNDGDTYEVWGTDEELLESGTGGVEAAVEAIKRLGKTKKTSSFSEGDEVVVPSGVQATSVDTQSDQWLEAGTVGTVIDEEENGDGIVTVDVDGSVYAVPVQQLESFKGYGQDQTMAKKKAGVLPEWYTEKHAKGDGYLSLEEAEHDAAVNGWAEDLRENDYNEEGLPRYKAKESSADSGWWIVWLGDDLASGDLQYGTFDEVAYREGVQEVDGPFATQGEAYQYMDTHTAGKRSAYRGLRGRNRKRQSARMSQVQLQKRAAETVAGMTREQFEEVLRTEHQSGVEPNEYEKGDPMRDALIALKNGHPMSVALERAGFTTAKRKFAGSFSAETPPTTQDEVFDAWNEWQEQLDWDFFDNTGPDERITIFIGDLTSQYGEDHVNDVYIQDALRFMQLGSKDQTLGLFL